MDPLPLSLLNDFLYCPRRAALKLVEGWRGANFATDRGDIVHQHSDLAGYEVLNGVTLLRALPVWSERLGLSGKCDIVEVIESPHDLKGRGGKSFQRVSGGLLPQPHSFPARFASVKPVEFKVGPRRRFENDDVQVCAQALCLEEMFGVCISGGAIFHADSKRRREVEFTPDLRAVTERTAAELHSLLSAEIVPPARYVEGRCEKCSLFDTCLPRVTELGSDLTRAAASLFQIR